MCLLMIALVEEAAEQTLVRLGFRLETIHS